MPTVRIAEIRLTKETTKMKQNGCKYHAREDWERDKLGETIGPAGRRAIVASAPENDQLQAAISSWRITASSRS
jgi:hypothetical protein